jgi:hypothetical protein
MVILMPVMYHGSGMPKRKLPPEIHAYFVMIGKRGGMKGGKARAEKLSPERRKEIAQKAIATRWEKAKKNS